ncbi:hypothetical protein ACTQ33_12110 [Candidatus Avoscillospira sp. LCP25S3_F1]|uniref:hypothetical protein n=1 Tax=Candidatus Avoscillospira sp. LCP25S3_F1 TaxID=3438825 RepID=UPI003F9189BE
MSESVNLNKCTKQELLILIGFMRQHDLGDRCFSLAWDEMLYKRDLDNLTEAKMQLQIARDARDQYCEIMKPYDGKCILDIPQDVFDQGAALLAQAEAADKKWTRLMGINRKKEKRK